ncbi:MAG TPA: hypothetical protein VND91_08680, partial [Candidatus Saccharimonadia bacterium]|nr:hypothetical protein [Candidatus Saccharimonadia bacterium]
MLTLTPSRKHAIGGALGLLLLAFAFAYRWIGPEALGLKPSLELPQPIEERAPTVASIPAAPGAPLASMPAPASSEPPSDALPAPEPQVDPGSVPEATRVAIEDALERAEAARVAGHLIEPPDDSALHWYDAALALDPDNESVAATRRAVLDALAEQAHVALDSGDAVPAGTLLGQLDPADGAAPDREALAARLEILPRVQEQLRQGAQRMALGRRFDPYEGSALESYRAALAFDPRNLAARQGLEQIERAVLEQALAA